MAVATGNSSCATLCDADTGLERGVAHGVAHVLDADFLGSPDANFNPAAWALGISQSAIYPNAGTMPGAADPAVVMSDSHGSYTTADDSTIMQNLDSLVSQHGVTLTEPSGNDGLNGVARAHHRQLPGVQRPVRRRSRRQRSDDAVSDDAIARLLESRGPPPEAGKSQTWLPLPRGAQGART